MYKSETSSISLIQNQNHTKAYFIKTCLQQTANCLYSFYVLYENSELFEFWRITIIVTQINHNSLINQSSLRGLVVTIISPNKFCQTHYAQLWLSM